MPLSPLHRFALSACIAAATFPTAPTATYSQSITFDGTLGTTRNLTGPNYQIRQSDGTTVGTNLFHSFGRFSLNQGESVGFFSANNIRNILARVTGGSPSLINGEIFTDSFAVNLFLINPKGIIFGSDASLDIGGTTRGSFIATTVDGITFPGGHQFSATNPGNRQSLLNIVGDPSGFLASQPTPAPIQVIGSSLNVYPDQRLLLLGGNVTLDNASFTANGGSIQLGSVAGAGIVDLSISDTQLSLQFPSSLPRGDIKIENGSKIDTGAFGSNGGDILIDAGSLSVTDGSGIFSGAIGSAKGGNILINVQGVTRFDGTDANGSPTAALTSVLLGDSTSRAGELQIDTGTLLVTNGALLSTSPILGQGGSGNIIINAQDSVIFDGEGSRNPSRAISSLAFAAGQGGDIQITTGSLFVRNGADLVTSTVGIGDAGDIVINARDTVVFDGIGTPNGGRISSASSSVEQGSIGDGGDIRIATGSLFITNGALLNSTYAGTGDAGAITIDARDQVVVDGASVISPSGISSSLLRGEGKGGDISIATGSFTASGGVVSSSGLLGKGRSGDIAISVRNNVTIANGSKINTEASGSNGGDILIEAGSLSVTDGSDISSGAIGSAKGGNIVINVQGVTRFDGTDANGDPTAALTSVLLGDSTSRAGNLQLNTGTLLVTNGALLFTSSTFGQGRSGDIVINAQDSVIFDGESSGNPSGAISSLAFAQGQGGDIQITTGSLFVRKGASLVTSTVGIGNAGDIVINARDTVVFDGIGNPNEERISSASSSVVEGGIGNGGDIRIATGSLFITNGALLNSTSAGIGDAGAIMIESRDQVVVDGASVISPSSIASFLLRGEGKGGDISIATGSFTASGGFVSSSNFLGKGDSGDIAISAQDNVTIRDGGYVSTQTLGEGDAGSLRIWAGRSVLLDSGKVSADSTSLRDAVIFEERRSGLSLQQFGLPQTQLDLLALLPRRSGQAGDIEIATPLMQLDRGSQIVSTTTSGDGGNIVLNIYDLLLMRRGSKISTTAGTFDLGGNGGNITINASKGFIVGVKGENSDITANAFTGSGGRVNITAQGIYGLQFRPKLTEFSDITASSTFGVSGVVAINTLGIDPSRGLQQLPVGLVDPSNRIDQKCAAGSGFRRSSFTVTGRGGLPENPLEPLQSGEGVASWVEVRSENTPPSSSTQNSQLKTPNSELRTPSPLIVEADSVMIGKNGSIQLVASQQMAEPGRFWYLPSCASLKESDR